MHEAPSESFWALSEPIQAHRESIRALGEYMDMLREPGESFWALSESLNEAQRESRKGTRLIL